MSTRFLYCMICFFTISYAAEKVPLEPIGIPKEFPYVIELDVISSPNPNDPVYRHYHWEKKEKGGWKGCLKPESVLNGYVTPKH